MCLEIVQYISNALLNVFSMDLDYFYEVAPVTRDILHILTAVGWALLMGNLVFQALKSMASGLGFEGEDPKLLFTRTFVFAFLLLASQQICGIGLGISSNVVQMLQVPTSVTITIPDESNFNIGASWLLIIIVGIVIMWQFVKLCFEVAERYVVTAILVLMAPLAFGLGGSRNTADIFKGWCRMFASMCLMMIMNIIFLKLLISALGYVPSGLAVLPWMLLIVGIARVARKIDGIVARVGLTPAITGDGLGYGLPGMVALSVIRGIGNTVTHSAAASGGGSKPQKGGGSGASNSPNSPPPPPGGGPGAAPGGAGRGGKQAGGGKQSSGGRQGQSAPHRGESAPRTASATGQSGEQTSPAASGHKTDPGVSKAGSTNSGSGYTTVQESTRRTSVPPEQRKSSGGSMPRSPFRQGSAEPPKSGQPGPDRAAAPVREAQQQAGPRTQRRTNVESDVSTQMSDKTAYRATFAQQTAQAVQHRPPIRQDGTPKIPTPPGVSMAKRGENLAGKWRLSNGVQPHTGAEHLADEAGTRQPSGAHRPPMGSGQPPADTAGTRQPSGAHRPPVGGGQPPADTAGTRQPSGARRPPVGGGQPPADMAGTRQPSGVGYVPKDGTKGPHTPETRKDKSDGTPRIQRPNAPPQNPPRKRKKRK